MRARSARRTSSQTTRRGPIASPTTIAAALSRPTPPNASGTSVPISPSSPAPFDQSRAIAQSFCSRLEPPAATSFGDELAAVCADQPVFFAQPSPASVNPLAGRGYYTAIRGLLVLRGDSVNPHPPPHHPTVTRVPEKSGGAHAAADAQRNHRAVCPAALHLQDREVTRRAPVQPSGWPSAIAPPLTFSRSGSIGSSWRHASTCAAKASFSSTRSIWSSVSPARLSAFRIGGHRADAEEFRRDAGGREGDEASQRRQPERAGALTPT